MAERFPEFGINRTDVDIIAAFKYRIEHRQVGKHIQEAILARLESMAARLYELEQIIDNRVEDPNGE